MNNEVKVSGGCSFMGLLQLALIILKLCNVITCSWWLVLLPSFITLFMIILGVIIAVLFNY